MRRFYKKVSNPGFEPGTVCVLGRRDNHYTNWTGCTNLPRNCLICPKSQSLHFLKKLLRSLALQSHFSTVDASPLGCLTCDGGQAQTGSRMEVSGVAIPPGQRSIARILSLDLEIGDDALFKFIVLINFLAIFFQRLLSLRYFLPPFWPS